MARHAAFYQPNQVRIGSALEVQLLEGLTTVGSHFDIVSLAEKDCSRATESAKQFVAAPLGYVDTIIIAVT